MTQYERGFMWKCAEYGVDGRRLIKVADMARPKGFDVDEFVNWTANRGEPLPYDPLSTNPRTGRWGMPKGMNYAKAILAERDRNGPGYIDFRDWVRAGLARQEERLPAANRMGPNAMDAEVENLAPDYNLVYSSPEKFSDMEGVANDDALKKRYNALWWGRMNPGDRGQVPEVGTDSGIGDNQETGSRTWAGYDDATTGSMA